MTDKPATRKDIDDILKVIKGMSQQTSDEFVSVNDQFVKINNRFDALEFNVNARFEKIDAQFIKIQESYDHLINTMDKFLARIETCETEQAAGDYRFQKLLDWARNVSKKTGIPLKDL